MLVLSTLFVLLLSYMCNCASAGCGGSDCESQCEDYKWYTLALQNWCDGDEWSIHGLWPDYSATCYPESCYDVEWEDVSGSLEQQMMTYWDWCSESTESQQSGWEHEWEKHGTCMRYYEGDEFSQSDFFNMALQAYSQVSSDGTIDAKCGEPNEHGSCYSICLDLDLNVIDCPSNGITNWHRHKHRFKHMLNITRT